MPKEVEKKEKSTTRLESLLSLPWGAWLLLPMLVLHVYLSNTLFATSPKPIYLNDLFFSLSWTFPLGILIGGLFYFLHNRNPKRAEYYFILTIGLQTGFTMVWKILSFWAISQGIYNPKIDLSVRFSVLALLLFLGKVKSEKFYFVRLAEAIRKFVVFVFIVYASLAILDRKFVPKYERLEHVPPKNSYPNIYFIVADAYPWPQALEKYWRRPAPLIKELEKRGFSIQKKAYTFFPGTDISMLCYWSMRNEFLDKWPPIFESIRALDSLGYQIRYFVSGYTPPRIIRGEEEYSFCTSEIDEVFLRTYLFPLGLLSKYIEAKSYIHMVSRHLLTTLTTPTFNYIHLPIPHRPYGIDSTGRPYLSGIGDASSEYRQIRYTDHVILRWIDTILAYEKKPPIIILRSDHGPVWDYLAKEFSPQTPKDTMQLAIALGSHVLSAFYLPPDFPEKPWDTISNGNVFRLILRGLTGDTLRFPYVKDIPSHLNLRSKKYLYQRLFYTPF
ncbi:MAG: hypothetical protein ACUVRD_06690 [Bacteroidia bacterium]